MSPHTPMPKLLLSAHYLHSQLVVVFLKPLKPASKPEAPDVKPESPLEARPDGNAVGT